MMTSSNSNGELFPKPLIKTWGCRISLDSEWCEKFKYIYVDKTRYPKFRSTGENRSNGPARRKNVKNCCFCLVTFLFIKIHDNIKRTQNSAWYQKATYQISSKNIENWQSYKGFKLWKSLYILIISLVFYPISTVFHKFLTFFWRMVTIKANFF